MGKKISAGIANVSRRCPKGWVGVNNVACKIKKGWVGDANGKARLFFSSGVDAGEVVFTASKSWVVPEGIKVIDIFCVGGGGGSGGGSLILNPYGYATTCSVGSGGAGGYTKSLLNHPVKSGDTLTITIGAGGNAGKARVYAIMQSEDPGEPTAGSAGGETSVYLGSTKVLSASGGEGGKVNPTGSFVGGANGGSGSGCGGSGLKYTYQNGSYVTNGVVYIPGTNGTDGGDGGTAMSFNQNTGAVITASIGVAGKGQGTTTRYFAESGKTLYSSAGLKTKVANTGNGGYGGDYDGPEEYSGQSGVVIIRWAAQED